MTDKNAIFQAPDGTLVTVLLVDTGKSDGRGNEIYRLGVDTVLDLSDIEIGAVELKDAATDTRAKIAAGSAIITTDVALAVRDANPIPAGVNAIGSIRPTDVGALGAYSISTLTGTMAAAFGGPAPCYSFRWGDATRLALIKRVSVAMMSLGTGFTAGVGKFELYAARGFSIADTGGGSVLPATNNNKLRTSFGTTLVSDLRQSSTAALTPGTRTLDAAALAQIMFGISTATNTVHLQTTDIFKRDLGAGDWPLILAQNEGFVIQATVPATGTWQMQVAVDWQEVGAF